MGRSRGGWRDNRDAEGVAQGTQFTCFTGTNVRAVLVQNTDADAWLKGPRSMPDSRGKKILMLYWYKRTNTDADAWLKGPRSKPAKPAKNQDASALIGTHFTCFTGTKVQILLQIQRSTKMRLLG